MTGNAHPIEYRLCSSCAFGGNTPLCCCIRTPLTRAVHYVPGQTKDPSESGPSILYGTSSSPNSKGRCTVPTNGPMPKSSTVLHCSSNVAGFLELSAAEMVSGGSIEETVYDLG